MYLHRMFTSALKLPYISAAHARSQRAYMCVCVFDIYTCVCVRVRLSVHI